MKRITFLLPLINIIGAVFTFLYFSLILKSGVLHENIPAYYSPLFFVIGTAVLVLGFNVSSRKTVKTLFKVAYGHIQIHSLEESEVYHLQREALRFPMVVSVITFMVWILAGFIFGLLQPLMASKIFSIETPNLIYCLRQFFGISLLGGGVTTLILYFVLENAWRKFIPKFFPEGYLSRVKHVFKLSVQKRFIIVFLGITLIPLPVLSIAIYSKIMALHIADAITRAQIMSSLVRELVFIVTDSLAICLILAYFLSKSISEPLLQIKDAIKKVEKNNLDARVEIVSNDELGDVAEGFNLMIKSMRESQNIKESFGKFFSQEIMDEIIAGKTSLDGEMKRATLLFSDLRNFTPLVEQNHPKHVVTIMNQYFNEMTLAIKANNGIVLQYVGDEIQAAFGAPIGIDDHPDMAVKAALEMRKRLGALNMRLEQQGFKALSHGIGIHSGAVLAGNIGSEDRMSYALVGDTVNSASRIEGLTKQYDSDIIISQTTFNLLSESYDTVQLESVRVKGKEDEIIIYKVL
ncbi:adenylate/guanylate cyclase domain-containing protein [Desulfosarcina sp.]|uniref:adenylate/guanylate cyclase domain-containing protein n=1 Tax=Desulfosarcina sp. TaxID=2027861 RepID=UPI0029B3CF87|nr:adenylate/guanylate cyclase domain-containing protein [Desulfosarcina sp.]MDX2451018.1 adenylate/guanylate cyclase domain-containing protein [Desulfosarcina sp.]MDX2488845.1 adenylate/guanylate cyclase domain-containing protein [Desulfosarcina sp.]